MHNVERLRTYYQKLPPCMSYGGSEGESLKGKVYAKWPEEELSASLGGPIVWRSHILAMPDVPVPDGYCSVDACLDSSGLQNPEALPLFPEMEGHELRVVVYVDCLNRIWMKAIGGFTANPK